MSEQQTIQSVIQGLGDDLRANLEAQYHVRDESVLHERKLLLQDGATIAQKPFLEATPAYVLADEYAKLDLPPATKTLLSELAKISKSGIFPKPYGHQARALEAFLKEQRDGWRQRAPVQVKQKSFCYLFSEAWQKNAP